MRPVFLDTSGLLALLIGGDESHKRAVAVAATLQRAGTAAVTTEWVLAELLGSTAKRRLRTRGLQLVRQILRDPLISVIPSGPASFAAALRLYEQRRDKEWSLVDCGSVLACEATGVRDVFTADHHFEQAGFTALLLS
jgi:predicted nucleic acid-binding protein